MDYKEKYKTLKEKVVDKYEYWLLRFILEDIIDVGEVDYLIGNDDELLFNQELSKEINEVINLYIKESPKIYDREFAIKLLELKKVTDNRLINNTDFNYNEVYEYIFEDILDTSSKPKRGITKIPLNSNIDSIESVIVKIYVFLKSNNYIECSEEEFISHFINKNQIEDKINWTGPNLITLVGFVTHLFDKDIIPKHKKRKERIKILISHFQFNGKTLNKGSIKTISSNTYNTKLYKEIYNFLNDLQINFS